MTRMVNGIAGAGPMLVLLLSIVYESWWPLILFVAFMVIAYPSILVFSPLHPLTDESVLAAKAGRRKEIVTVLLVLAAMLALIAPLGWLVD